MSRSPASGDSYSFASPAIQAAIQSLNPALKSYKASLDALCADIVAVERYLDDKMVLLPVSMGTGETLSDDEDAEKYYVLEWAQDESKKYRLRYSLWESNLFDPTGEADTLLESKALAEAPLRLRVRLFKHIPNFLQVVEREVGRWQVDCADSMTNPKRPPRKAFEIKNVTIVDSSKVDFSV